MIIDKEYPATHSMYTSWFGIDKDGKVALLEFEDNGPVPTQCSDTCAEEILLVDFAVFKDNVGFLHYTPEQAREMEARLMPVSVADLEGDRILKIDTDRTQEFIDICRNRKLPQYSKDYYTVISEEVGLFYVRCDWDDSVKYHLIDSGIVLGYTDFHYFFSDDYQDENGVWHHYPPKGAPFYLYRQPYYTGNLMELEYKPLYPFTKDQLPKEMLKRGIKFPFSFNDHPYLQIAEYAQCTSYAPTRYKQRLNRIYEYFELPFENGGMALFLDNILGDPIVRSKIDKPNLTWKDCYDLYTRQMAIHPTVLVLTIPQNGSVYTVLEKIDAFKRYSYVLAILSGSEYYGKEEIKDITVHSKWESFVEEFIELRFNFEYALEKLRPNVIVASEDAMQLLKTQYEISDNTLKAMDAQFPIYTISDVASNQDTIMKLARAKYKGSKPRRILPIKENEK